MATFQAAIETSSGRCDTTVAHRNERDSKWQDRHVEQHQHSTAERPSKTSCFQAIPNQRPQLHVGPLHSWMRAWSNEGETMLVSVESTDKFDNKTLAMDCSTLYQVLHRATANEPLRRVQQNTGTDGKRNVARDCEETRSQEHRQNISTCSTDQPHLGETEPEAWRVQRRALCTTPETS